MHMEIREIMKLHKTHKAVRFALTLTLPATLFLTPMSYAEESAEEVERISVTGSRIKRAEMEGANPVQVLEMADMEKMGLSSVGDILQTLTSSAGAASNTQNNNGSDGATRFSLRGIGSQRTLVLMNGRRIVAGGAGADVSVDLNAIPVGMIKRIEVLKDGASAVYGSDAIAGVVNIITRDDFDGFEAKGMIGQQSEGDGKQKGIDISIGSNSDRGNSMITFGYHEQESIFMGDRKFSEYELRAYPDGHTEQGGSSASPWANVDGAPGSANDPDNPLADANVTRGPDYGEWRERDGSIDSYNYNPVNYLQTPRKRFYIAGSSNYELGSFSIFQDAVAFGEVSYSQTSGSVLIAPEPLAPLIFFGTAAPYSADNFYNQTQGPKDADGNSYQLNDWRRRMLESGGREDTQESRTSRVVFGLNGQFSNGWDWEISYNYGENSYSQVTTGNYHLSRVAEAVGPTHTDTDGVLRCGATTADLVDGCVPLNIFGQPGTDTEITDEMMQYISGNYPTMRDGGNKQTSWQAIVNGDLMELPAGAVGFAAGIESRKESGYYQPDSLLMNGITTAGDSQPTQGGYSVDEAFLEVIIPVIDSFEVDFAVRFSDYSNFGSNTTGKLGVSWRPTENILLRATASQAFRAPNIDELYRGAAIDFPEVHDRCADDDEVGNPNCIASGVPASGYNDDGVEQIPTLESGSATLEPEEADILTAGIVYNSDLLDNLSFTLDYWSIDLTNAISQVGAQNRLDGCTDLGLFCDGMVRFPDGPAEGQFIHIEDPFLNIGGIETSGIDFNANFTADSSFGEFKFNFNTTYLLEYNKIVHDQLTVAHEGRFDVDNDGHFAEWKSNFSVDWVISDFSTNLTLNYISGVEETEKGWWTDPFQRDVDANLVLNGQTSYFVNDNITLSLGINNILDEEPPYVYSAFGANTDVNTYQVTGRYVYLQAGLSF